MSVAIIAPPITAPVRLETAITGRAKSGSGSTGSFAVRSTARKATRSTTAIPTQTTVVRAPSRLAARSSATTVPVSSPAPRKSRL